MLGMTGGGFSGKRLKKQESCTRQESAKVHKVVLVLKKERLNPRWTDGVGPVSPAMSAIAPDCSATPNV